jgi:signal transduction histidine kinase
MMLSSPLFRRNFLLFTLIVLVFASLALVFNSFYHELQRDKLKNLRPFPVVIATLLLEVDSDPLKAVEKALSHPQVRENEILDVVDGSGKSFSTGGQVFVEPLSDVELMNISAGEPVMRNMDAHGPPSMILSTNAKNHFFYVAPVKGKYPRPPSFLFSLVILMFSVLFAIGLALYIMFSSYKKKSEEALAVLSAIRGGDLSVRLNTQGMDELKPIVYSFNAMADEIASLVESLQRTDSARRRLLQDLAHDLRTPLTSVKSFLETIKDSSNKISTERKIEALAYCVSEVNYFSNLVEDLLFLANISEPNYILANEKVDVVSQIENLVSLFQAQYSNKSILCDLQTKQSPKVIGSQKLFERLMRNALSNAISFSRHRVQITIAIEDNFLRLTLKDDGPGFSPEALASFGVKKVSRQIFKEEEGSRISLGIGSLIMKEIVMIHRGTIVHSNSIHNNQVTGAIVEISLPFSI